MLRTVRSPSVSVVCTRIRCAKNNSLLCAGCGIGLVVRSRVHPLLRVPRAPRVHSVPGAGRGPVVAVRRVYSGYTPGRLRSRGRAGLRPIPGGTERPQRRYASPLLPKPCPRIVAHALTLAPNAMQDAQTMQTDDTTIHTARHSRSGLPRYPPPGLCRSSYRLKQLSSVRCVCRHAIPINDPHSSQPLAGLAVHLHTLTNSIAPHKLRMPPSVPRPMLLPARARGLPSPLLPRLHHLLLVKLARGTAFTLR